MIFFYRLLSSDLQLLPQARWLKHLKVQERYQIQFTSKNSVRHVNIIYLTVQKIYVTSRTFHRFISLSVLCPYCFCFDISKRLLFEDKSTGKYKQFISMQRFLFLQNQYRNMKVHFLVDKTA